MQRGMRREAGGVSLKRALRVKGLDFISVTMGCHWRVFKQEQCVLICVVGGSLWLQFGGWALERPEKRKGCQLGG